MTTWLMRNDGCFAGDKLELKRAGDYGTVKKGSITIFFFYFKTFQLFLQIVINRRQMIDTHRSVVNTQRNPNVSSILME